MVTVLSVIRDANIFPPTTANPVHIECPKIAPNVTMREIKSYVRRIRQSVSHLQRDRLLRKV